MIYPFLSYRPGQAFLFNALAAVGDPLRLVVPVQQAFAVLVGVWMLLRAGGRPRLLLLVAAALAGVLADPEGPGFDATWLTESWGRTLALLPPFLFALAVAEEDRRLAWLAGIAWGCENLIRPLTLREREQAGRRRGEAADLVMARRGDTAHRRDDGVLVHVESRAPGMQDFHGVPPCGVLDGGHHAHAAATPNTGQDVQRERVAHEVRPRPPARCGRRRVCHGHGGTRRSPRRRTGRPAGRARTSLNRRDGIRYQTGLPRPATTAFARQPR
jgi:hypothetical protein